MHSRTSQLVEVLDLLPGESRGYWKQHSPGKWFRQAKIHGKINNEKAILLLDTGAEVSIVDTAFARKVGCYIDRSQSQECVGIGENVFVRAGSYLGMDFMVPAGIRLDLADGSLCSPDEIRIHLSGLRQLYNDKVQHVKLDQHLQLAVGESAELPVRLRRSGHDKLWVTRGDLWVPTVVNGPGKTTYLQITNVGENNMVLCRDERIGMWLAGDQIPRLQGFVNMPESMVERPNYQTPRAILRRLDPACIPPTEVGPSGSGGRQDKLSLDPTGLANTKDIVTPARVSEARRQLPVKRSGPDPDDMVPGERPLGPDPGGDQLKGDGNQNPVPATGDSLALLNSTADLGLSSETQDPEEAQDPVVGEETVSAVASSSEEPDPTDNWDPGPDDSTADEQVCYHESGDLHAEDVAAEMAVLPEVTSTTEEMTIENIQEGDPDINTPEEIGRLRRRIWRRRHLLIGKGNELPPATRGVVCDIDVGNAHPIA
ncbi:unnamed protein product [Phytophthora fragariaefolia]|uniref:Unnamed protein product n=1 Tax=Phytophthora fragariaefolia TaxID=1490495 RepID=A0A9W7DBA4_9STRA|nr:unnamed protein product [Phytophthora fragariaefolia]